MKTKLITSLIAASLAVGAALHGATLVYEPFNQTAGDLGGQAGGTGLSGNWTATEDFAIIAETASYGTLPHSGGQLTADGTQTVASITTAGNYASADGTTQYFSMLVSLGANASSDHSGFGFGTTNVQSNFSGLQMSSGNGIGIYTSKGNIAATTWVNGGLKKSSNLSPALGAEDVPMFIVGKVDWGLASETVTIYGITDLSLGLTNIANYSAGVSVTTTPGFDQTALNTMSFGVRSAPYKWDELRFGDTLADVTTVPEPSAALLGAFGLLALLLRRRR
jgi:MYXO-CTERM domain-containing protein